MASETDKLLIHIKPHGTVVKPQQRSWKLDETGLEIEWSTASNVPMTIDFFNITIGRIIQSGGPSSRKIEESWRVTHVPGHARKILYGANPPEATSTSAQPLMQGLYVIKITGMSALAEGLHVESGMGAMLITLTEEAGPADMDMDDTARSVPSKQTSHIHADATPVRIVNETVLKFLTLIDEDEQESGDQPR